MSKKIAIILKNHGNNRYSFLETSDIFPPENNIKITNDNYNKLIKCEPVNFVANKIEPDQNIYLIFDEDKLMKQAQKNGETEEAAKEAVKQALNSIGNEMEDITLDTVDGMAELKISFIKEKYKEINIKDIDPDAVISTIKEKVVAQDNTVETIVNNIYNNQIVVESKDSNYIKTQKAHIILDGPTGTGKTLIMKEVAENMSLPIYITQSTMYTTTGYQGVELQRMLIELLKRTDGNLEAAQRGIVVLDEFDKLGNGEGSSSLEIRKAVQEDLLTYLSGATYTVEYKGKSYDFDTSNLTFVCLGAFTDYREKQKDYLDENGNYEMTPEDYIKSGIMRELVGRLQLNASTQSLGKADLRKILVESSISPMKNLQGLAKDQYKTNLIFDEEIIDEIVEIAYETNTGARALSTIVADIRNLVLNKLIRNFKSTEIVDLHVPIEIMQKLREKYLREGLKK